MNLNKKALFIIFFYILLVVWWVLISIFHLRDTIYNTSFAFAYGLIPIIVAVFGFQELKRWGFLKSSMGKAILFISFGLLTWGIGEMIWSYYNFFLLVEVPYPSLADVSFILSWPLWTVGTIYLSFATGVKYELKNLSGKLQILIIPFIVIILSYYLLVVVARQNVFEFDSDILKLFFDLAYPVWDVIILTISIIIYGLSFKLLGGKYKYPILIILFGFVINYFADMGFSYTTTLGIHYNGNWVDLLFATAMFLLGLGLVSFNTPKNDNKLENIENTADLKQDKFESAQRNIIGVIIKQIITDQEKIIGPLAIEYAKSVSGLSVSGTVNQLEINLSGNGSKTLKDLVEAYKDIFGNASVSVVKESVAKVLNNKPEYKGILEQL